MANLIITIIALIAAALVAPIVWWVFPYCVSKAERYRTDAAGLLLKRIACALGGGFLAFMGIQQMLGGSFSKEQSNSELKKQIQASYTSQPAVRTNEASKSTLTAQGNPVNDNGIEGNWAGQLEGQGELSIRRGPSSYQFSLTVKSEAGEGPVCSGEVSGEIPLQGEFKTFRDAETGCRIDFSFKGRLVELSEINCMTFHGASCSFEGSLQKR
ncbi:MULTISPECIES: hypothetical protein [Pseudomonas]|nr:hypothetical protein [Pseudomonas putida]